MLTGPFINAAAVLIGGTLGAVLSHRLPERVRGSMPAIFGLCSLGYRYSAGGEVREPAGDGAGNAGGHADWRDLLR